MKSSRSTSNSTSKVTTRTPSDATTSENSTTTTNAPDKGDKADELAKRTRNTRSATANPAELRTRGVDELLTLDAAAHGRCDTVERARKLLAKTNYIMENTPITCFTLAHTIMMLMNVYPAGTTMDTSGSLVLRAIAVLLANEDTSAMASMIASRVSDFVDSIKEQAEESIKAATRVAVNSITEATTHVDQAAEKLSKQAQDTHEELQKLATESQDAQGHFEDLESAIRSLESLDARVRDATTLVAAGSPPLTQTSNPVGSTPSWADVAASTPRLHNTAAPHHAEARAKAALDASYIILDLSGEGATTAAKQSEKELLQRAQVAIEAMGLRAADKPKPEIFRAVRKLEHGGIRLQMVDGECAAWLRQVDVRKEFLDAFQGGGAFKDRSYNVILEYVPTTFNTNLLDDERHALERINGIPEGSIVSAKWLKNPNRWNKNQRTAFLELNLKEPTPANAIIRDGAVIEGKAVTTRKKRVEPAQCHKCKAQGVGHKAANCKSTHDVCDYCGEPHRTEECKKTGPPCCINCRKAGLPTEHRASSRSCPAYLKAVERMRRIHPENRYKYYLVIDDPNTWELSDDIVQDDPYHWYGPQQNITWTKPHTTKRTVTNAKTSKAGNGTTTSQNRQMQNSGFSGLGRGRRSRPGTPTGTQPTSRPPSRLRQTTLTTTSSRTSTPTPHQNE
jgi:hypothetical protein